MNMAACPIADIRAGIVQAVGSDLLCVRSESPLYTLASSVCGGGFGWRTALLNREVDKSYRCDDPHTEMERYVRACGFNPGETAAMLTAARVADYGRGEQTLAGKDGKQLAVCGWVTVGLGNAARAGMTASADRLYPGTINTIVVVDGAMSDAAMVGAIITATEAKTAALQQLGVAVDGTESLATGTTTDAVIVAATQRGVRYDYAGTATKLGYMVGRVVYDATIASAERYFRHMATRAASRSSGTGC